MPPPELNDIAKREWVRLAGEIERLGLLTKIDGGLFAAYCDAWSDFLWAIGEIAKEGRTTVAGNGTRIVHPAVQVKLSAVKKLRELGTDFGFTPTSRVGLPMIEPDDPDLKARLEEDNYFFGPRPLGPPPRRASAPPARAPRCPPIDPGEES
jgi:P27 family predicted phage terminase small subunit